METNEVKLTKQTKTTTEQKLAKYN